MEVVYTLGIVFGIIALAFIVVYIDGLRKSSEYRNRVLGELNDNIKNSNRWFEGICQNLLDINRSLNRIVNTLENDNDEDDGPN